MSKRSSKGKKKRRSNEAEPEATMADDNPAYTLAHHGAASGHPMPYSMLGQSSSQAQHNAALMQALLSRMPPGAPLAHYPGGHNFGAVGGVAAHAQPSGPAAVGDKRLKRVEDQLGAMQLPSSKLAAVIKKIRREQAQHLNPAVDEEEAVEWLTECAVLAATAAIEESEPENSDAADADDAQYHQVGGPTRWQE
eukprot:1896410-Rhodomonas_salina.2